MAKFTDQEIRTCCGYVERALLAGAKPPGIVGQGRSAIEIATELAEAAGAKIPKGHASIRRRLQEGERRGIVPDWSLYKPPQYVKPVEIAKEHPVHVGPDFAKPSGKIDRVCVIPDIHIDPRIPHDRMAWIGRWCADMAPDYIVQLGDWLTLDSLSVHSQPGTIERMVAPLFKADIEALRASLEIFQEGFQGKATKIITMGNHENRAQRFENRTPELQGTIYDQIVGMFEATQFRVIPYGEFVFINGVGFIHHVNNTLGRPYGGKTASQRIATDANFSTVFGHTHQRQSAAVPKIGPNAAVRAISAGCALPFGHVEHYAKHSTTGWDFGCLMISICEGQILDEQWFSMITLEKRYSGGRKAG